MTLRFTPSVVAAAAVVSLAASTASAQNILINEVWADDGPASDVEYIELYSPTGASLAGLSLIAVNGDTLGMTTSVQYRRVALRIDFAPGDAIPPNGYLLAGAGLPAPHAPDRTFSFGSIPNGTMTVAIVRTQDIAVCRNTTVCPSVDLNELTTDSVTAIAANLIDAIAIRDDDAADHVYFGAPAIAPNPGGFAWDLIARIPNGVDTDTPADWQTQDNFSLAFDSPEDLLSSPRAPNDAAAGACCLPNGECRSLSPGLCSSLGGVYSGDGSTCGQVVCQTPSGCICEVDGQPGTSVFDLLEFLDCWFDGCP